ncbi:hypothetical protein PBRA_003878 [Plasmodiophora brassicae]|uniref:DYW domain-containing protein n=1 Tax=Plasmodiophora brassicae TaxID=37360 RepID=A0A0G4IJ54_PLABS|nr:hypothetical protein PBRA_003878 [Plasmodiophora brassicae]
MSIAVVRGGVVRLRSRRHAALASLAADGNATAVTTQVHRFQEFMTSSDVSVRRAINCLSAERDPVRAWAVFRRVHDSGARPDVRFYQSMMTFCLRCLPTKAPVILMAAASRRVRICDALLGTFLGACQSARPPMLREAFAFYDKFGAGSDYALHKMAELCRSAGRQDAALGLVLEAVNQRVALSEKSLSLFALCCAEARSPAGASVAEQIVALMLSRHMPAYRNRGMFVNLLNAMLAQGRVESAVNVLPAMEFAGVYASPTIYGMVIKALSSDERHAELAYDVFHIMVHRNMRRDPALVALVIETCGRAGRLCAVYGIHQHVREIALADNEEVVVALITVYGQLGHLGLAERLFRIANKSGTPGAAVFSAMITAYGHHGLLDQALQVFRDMKYEGRDPDQVTLHGLLTACSNAGHVASATAILSEFSSTWPNIQLDARHLQCIVDLHGRTGALNDAERLADARADLDLCMAVLHACRRHGDVDRAERVFDRIAALAIDAPLANVSQAYTVMAFLYSRAGRVPDLCRIRQEMRDKGIPEPVDETSVLLPKQSVGIQFGDVQYATDADLRNAHARMMDDLARHGYCPDLSATTELDLPNDEATRVVTHHSTKVALAYALRVLGPKDPIRLRRHGRLCQDCHEAAKSLSLIRDVYVRDTQRLHCFVQGYCSCRDYW